MSHLRATRFVFVVPTTQLAESIRFYREGIGLELLEEWSDMGRGALFRASDDARVELIEMLTRETKGPHLRPFLGWSVPGSNR